MSRLIVVNLLELVVNATLFFLAIAMLYFGLIMKTGSSDIFVSLTRDIKANFDKHLKLLGVTNVNIDNFSFGVFLKPVGAFLVPMALRLIGLVVVGFVCFAMPTRQIIPFYCGLLFVSFLVQSAMTVCAYLHSYLYNGPILNKLLDTVHMYSSIGGEDTYSVTWNAVMTYYGCCGLRGYEDYGSKDDTYQPPHMERSFVSNYTQLRPLTPIACCKADCVLDPRQEMACVVSPTRDNSNIHTGCYGFLADQILASPLVAIFIWGSLALEVTLIILKVVAIKLYLNSPEVFKGSLPCPFRHQGTQPKSGIQSQDIVPSGDVTSSVTEAS